MFMSCNVINSLDDQRIFFEFSLMSALCFIMYGVKIISQISPVHNMCMMITVTDPDDHISSF